MAPYLAVIFDQDGVLIEDTHFPIRTRDLRWTPGAIELVAALNRVGVKVGVATNQSGVARGYFDEAAVVGFHNLMQSQLHAAGAHIDAFAYCPHHPTEGQGKYRVTCECRKPRPGMLKHLLEKLEVSAGEALMIGDRATDLESARHAGMRGLLFSGGNLREFMEPLWESLGAPA
jgi:D-glycero-D-manno-heptose 1,7-bisphosphate phosphatase